MFPLYLWSRALKLPLSECAEKQEGTINHFIGIVFKQTSLYTYHTQEEDHAGERQAAGVTQVA